MLGILLRTAFNALGLWLAAELISGITVTSTGALIWTAIALGLVNAIVRPLVVLLTLPVTLLTLGLFLLIINAGMLNLAAWFVDGFSVTGFIASVMGAVVVSIVSWAGSAFIGKNGRYEVMVVTRRERR
jgi:putative membrane protein